ncbi:hypothetical protein DXG03_007349 [Asterophora parasitica]|uniref:Uncharacterized protein n=1 Tax=Asterophora parasitica TaxID=117018 RepID=A0A9P7GD26_9AGAR|nr:hypothetical protein DXG03_007349 [Asterophora parasitica]
MVLQGPYQSFLPQPPAGWTPQYLNGYGFLTPQPIPQQHTPQQYWTPQGRAGEIDVPIMVRDEERKRRMRQHVQDTLRRMEQIAADEELAMRMQQQEEELLRIESTRTAEADRGWPMEVRAARESWREADEIRPFIPSRGTPFQPSPPVEPFIPPLPLSPLQRPANPSPPGQPFIPPSPPLQWPANPRLSRRPASPVIGPIYIAPRPPSPKPYQRPPTPPVVPFVPPLPSSPTENPIAPRSILKTRSKEAPQPATTERTASSTQHKKLCEFKDLFTRDLKCSRCNIRMPVRPTTTNQSLGKQLHVLCPSCPNSTRPAHCRGCGKPTACKHDCNAMQSDCKLPTCCRRGRAIALFELLGTFDKLLSSSAESFTKSNTWPVPQSERADYLRFMTCNSDPRSTRPFNTKLTSMLEIIQMWLPREHSVHRSVRPMLEMSLLLETIRAYVKDRTASRINWVVYGELYTEILGFLILLGSHDSLLPIVTQRLPAILTSSGMHALIWDPDLSEWTADADSDTRKTLYTIAGATELKTALSKFGAKLASSQSQAFIEQFVFDINHIGVIDVLS